MYRGSWLTVTSLGEENYTISKANFAELLEEPSLHVQYVTEFKDHLSLTDSDYNPYLLVVILNRKVIPAAQVPSSIICLYDSRLKKIVRAIDCPFAARVAETIISTDSGRASTLIACLDEQLESFHGLVVVGCEGGLVTFVDLCLDQEISNTIPPRKVTFAAKSTNTHSYDMDTKRRTAIVHGQHVTLPLNAECQTKHYFHYRSGGEEKSEPRPIASTFVTCIKYVPQINALCIAFNFGGYQVYDLKTLDLLFRGDTSQVKTAVINFSFQEPEEDPKNYCYLWMTRGSTVKEFIDEECASIHLNVMTFKDKTWVDDFGYLYTNFVNSSCMFEYDCTGFPYLADSENCSLSVIINCGTIEQGSPWYFKSNEDEGANDLSLFFVAWEATNETTDAPLTYFAVFDINQYYQAQVPRVFDVSKDNHLCPYFGIFSLSEVTTQLPNETILDFRINPNSIRRYRSNLCNHDLHYFPSSLSFDASVLTEKSSIDVAFLGLQNYNLSTISSKGSSVVIDPKAALKMCFQAGLLPVIPPQDTKSQRIALLQVMLQNEQMNFLLNIIKSWSTREYDHIGCSLEFLMEWIWSQVGSLKSCIDQVSEPLFPSSKDIFDENYGVKTLYSYEVDLNNLHLLIKKILECNCLTSATRKEVEKKKEWTHMICLYLRIMLWMIDCKLLPEQEGGEFSYKYSVLRTNYKNRRKILRDRNPSIKSTSFLIIDGIVESVKDQVSKFWKTSGGDSVFPPRSLHSLIGIYLLEGVPLERKHEITQYFLLEMAASLPEDKPEAVEKVKSFQNVMSLKQSLVDFVEGSWALDAQLFPFALQLLMKPDVKRDYFTFSETDTASSIAFKSDIHHRILTCLVSQNEALMAQQFASVCKWIGSCGVSAKDYGKKIRSEISMLLLNKQPITALELVRMYRDREEVTDLFSDFLSFIESTKDLKNLLKMSLNGEEQHELKTFLLHKSKNPESKKILLLHLLTQNRIMEADSILDIIRQEETANNPASAALMEDLELLVDRYKKALPPSMTQKLIQEVHVEEQKYIRGERKEDSAKTIDR
jgi:hypothetical protein